MLPGYQLTRLVDTYKGPVHARRRLEINGWPIHHTVLSHTIRRKLAEQRETGEAIREGQS